MATKKCSKCGNTKPTSQFQSSTIPTCKACSKAKKKGKKKRGSKK